jgi:predicted DCC family thiol-disulfide oxidoreductase YuxK
MRASPTRRRVDPQAQLRSRAAAGAAIDRGRASRWTATTRFIATWHRLDGCWRRHLPLRSPRTAVIVLYDAECGFCRWATAWVIQRDSARALVTVPIQSPLGAELLADLHSSDRLRAAHVVWDDGRRHSGGAAAADVLGALRSTRVLAGVARSLPRTTNLIYGVVAERRNSVGRLVRASARQRADRLIQASSVRTSIDLAVRSQGSPT